MSQVHWSGGGQDQVGREGLVRGNWLVLLLLLLLLQNGVDAWRKLAVDRKNRKWSEIKGRCSLFLTESLVQNFLLL